MLRTDASGDRVGHRDVSRIAQHALPEEDHHREGTVQRLRLSQQGLSVRRVHVGEAIGDAVALKEIPQLMRAWRPWIPHDLRELDAPTVLPAPALEKFRDGF